MQLFARFFSKSGKNGKAKVDGDADRPGTRAEVQQQQILEFYANWVDRYSSDLSTISGFGEASHELFQQGPEDMPLPEAALLAGIIERPSYLRLIASRAGAGASQFSPRQHG